MMPEHLGLTLDEWKYLDESTISSGRIKAIGINEENGEKYVRLEYTIPSKEDRDKATYDAAIAGMKAYLEAMKYEQELFDHVRKTEVTKSNSYLDGHWFDRFWLGTKDFFRRIFQ